MGKRLTARKIMETFEPGDYVSDSETEHGMTVPKTPSDYDYEPVTDVNEFWNRKLQNAKLGTKDSPSLYDSIKREGQKKPISLNMETKEILDGHHRLAVLYHLNPDQFVKYRSWRP